MRATRMVRGQASISAQAQEMKCIPISHLIPDGRMYPKRTTGHQPIVFCPMALRAFSARSQAERRAMSGILSHELYRSYSNAVGLLLLSRFWACLYIMGLAVAGATAVTHFAKSSNHTPAHDRSPASM